MEFRVFPLFFVLVSNEVQGTFQKKTFTKLYSVLSDDPLHDYVIDAMRSTDTAPLEENIDNSIEVQTTNPADDDMAAKEVDLDLEYFLLVSGVMQIQLIELPTQPRCYGDCTVAPRKYLLPLAEIVIHVCLDSGKW